MRRPPMRETDRLARLVRRLIVWTVWIAVLLFLGLAGVLGHLIVMTGG